MSNTASPPGRPVAIVTGGARGLGLATALALARGSFDVAITGRSDPAALDHALVSQFEEQGARLRYFQHDTTDLAAHPHFVAAVREWGGRLDTLVNTVGLVSRPRVDILDLEPRHLDAMYHVNLRGTFFLSQAFARLLLSETPHGGYRSIINVTSIAAEIANTGLAHYCMSKAALAMATRVLALKLAAGGIMVHEVRPGFVWRDAASGEADTPLNRWIKAGGVPARRAGDPEDVGAAIASLAAGRMPYMTGQPLWIAGGMNVPVAE